MANKTFSLTAEDLKSLDKIVASLKKTHGKASNTMAVRYALLTTAKGLSR